MCWDLAAVSETIPHRDTTIYAGEEDGHGLANERSVRKIAYSSAKEGRLLWWDEVPAELQFNRYIASGYRANLSYCQCLGTLFSLHNETGVSEPLQLLNCVPLLPSASGRRAGSWSRRWRRAWLTDSQ